jgi:hypothetical protein
MGPPVHRLCRSGRFHICRRLFGIPHQRPADQREADRLLLHRVLRDRHVVIDDRVEVRVNILANARLARQTRTGPAE